MNQRVILVGALVALGFVLMRHANAGTPAPSGGSAGIGALTSALGGLLGGGQTAAPSFDVSSPSVASAATAQPDPAPAPEPAPAPAPAPAPSGFAITGGRVPDYFLPEGA